MRPEDTSVCGLKLLVYAAFKVREVQPELEEDLLCRACVKGSLIL